jgi:eukaryotic-like serine/threonine-protein kinase
MMALTAGTRLGPYEVLDSVGAGGMGEVYRAHDSRLNRTVAIKVLPEAFIQDSGRLKRFEQEARSIAALNHPNILGVYDIGVTDFPYVVLEFLDGKTLRDRLNEGPIPVVKAVEMGQQIARGLAAAHERAIVHRDLKPENIFLTKDGQVKILDFGLAKPLAFSAEATLGSHTVPGVVLGTAGYMAPEQVRGESVDQRADIFSFGAVMYEMLGGKRAFNGDSSVEVMTAVLKSDPPEFDVALKISPGLDRIVRHCLEKNPADRFQTARDLNFALGALSGSDVTAAQRAIQKSSRPRWIPWAIAGAALLALLMFAVLTRHTTSAHRMQFAIPVKGELSSFAISSDGEMLAYVTPEENTGIGVLYVQHIGDPKATRLDGTEGASYPFWSPDHKYIGFFTGSHLEKIAATGGVPQVLAAVSSPRGGTWGSKDVIIYAPWAGGPLWRVNPDGSKNEALTKESFQDGEASHRFPLFLPDGDHFVYWAGNFNELPGDKVSGLYVGSLSGKQKDLAVLCRSNGAYAEGTLYYVDDQNSLEALPMNGQGKVTGESKVEIGLVGRYPSTYWSAISASLGGTIVYQLGTGAPTSQLTLYGRDGKLTGTVGEAGIMANPTFSPDDTRLTVDIIDLKTKNIDVWIENLKSGTASRFTFDASEETNGTWSPDGSTIAIRSASDNRLQTKKSFGLESPHVVLHGVQHDDDVPTGWTPDAKLLLTTSQPVTGGSSLALVDLQGAAKPFLKGTANYTNGQFSPNGKWVLYSSNESGDWEIYATPFPSAAGKVQISRGGGTEPRWRGDGKEAYFLGPQNVLTAVAINEDAGVLSAGASQTLFQIPGRAPISSTDLFTYDVTKDGKRFLVNRYLKPTIVAPLNIVLNATEHEAAAK